MKIKTGDVVLNYLNKNRVRHVFLITGGAIGFLIDSFSKRKDIEYVCALHEQSAAMMADAYSRVGPDFAATMVTSGPGATNLITGIYCSWFDSIPNIHITGQVNMNEQRSFLKSTKNCRQIGFQETDIVELSKNFTKKSIQITDSKKIYKVLEELYTFSKSGRKGPVLLDIPINIQKENIQKQNFNFKISKKEMGSFFNFSKQIFDLLKKSKRPVIILGAGIRLSGLNEKHIKKLLKKIRVPYVLTWGGFDILDYNENLNFNTLGVYGHRSSNFIVQNSDLLITIGCRLDTRTTGSRVDTFAPSAKIISIDIDKNELNKNRGTKIFKKIHQDAAIFTRNLIESKFNSNDHEEWIDYCQNLKRKYPYEKESTFKRKYVEVYSFIRALSDHCNANSIIIPDDGGHLTWTMQAFKIKNGQRLFSAFGNSPMGYSLPASIGAAFAQKNKTIICIDGDGSLMINVQDLFLVSKHHLNIKIFIINNDGYGIIRQFQSLYMEKRYEASKKGLENPDFKKIAQSYDLPYELINNQKTMTSKIKKIMNKKGPVFIEVRIDANQTISPKLEFGRPIEDLSPLISRKDFIENTKFVKNKKTLNKKQKDFQEIN
jgi:acetolactate synthase-1/2/3 large subunit